MLALLDEEAKGKISHAIDSDERRAWTNLPAKPNAGGIRMGDMNEAQVKAVCDLLATLVSESGYQKFIHVMLADDQLLKNGRARRGFGTENFSIVIFGTPAEDEPWSVQLDGHHVGLNVALSGDQLTILLALLELNQLILIWAGSRFALWLARAMTPCLLYTSPSPRDS